MSRALTALALVASAALFTVACDKKESGVGPDACALVDGEDCCVKIDTDAARCAKGDGTACEMHGIAHEQRTVGPGKAPEPAATKHHAKAAQAYLRGCEAGNGDACWRASVRFTTGEGVERDRNRALSLLDKGCDLSSSKACYELGVAEETGNGRPVDRVRAHASYVRACQFVKPMQLHSTSACEKAKEPAPPAP